MGRRKYWVMIVPLVVLSGPSHSQEVTDEFKAYKCTVQSAYQVDRGGLSPAEPARSFAGQVFAVDRKTGAIGGALFDSYGKIRILDPGSNSQSYKVIYRTSPNVSIRMLVVNEYQEGSKEFILIANSVMYTGHCESLTGTWSRKAD